MTEITLKIDGMKCEMCESHMNDTIRNNFQVKKVTSSHSKGITKIITENEIGEDALHKAIDPTGYKLLEISSAPYEKKEGLMSRLFGKK